MKVLLVRPDTFESHFKKWLRRTSIHGGVLPCLGLEYIAGAVEKAGYDTHVMDLVALDWKKRRVMKELTCFKPDVVGITTTSFTFHEAVEFASMAKELDPHTLVIVGGPHVGIYPRETMMHKCFDYGVLGDGEKTIVRLLHNIELGVNEDLDGLAYRKNGETRVGKPVIERDLDSLPLPARHLFPNDKYYYFLAKKSPITTMISSRGCPYACRFCDKVPGRDRLRFRSPINVVDELELCVKQGFSEVYFVDDSFTVNSKHVYEICNLILERGMDIVWDCRARVNNVSQDLLEKMAKAGCTRIYFGVESADERVLSLMNKRITLDMVRKAFSWSKNCGIETLAYYIFGFSGEDINAAVRTLEFAKRLDSDLAFFSTFTPLPASPIYADLVRNGVLNDDPWLEYVTNIKSDFPLFDLSKVTFEDVSKFTGRAYRQFYLSWKFFAHGWRFLNSSQRLKRLPLAILAILIENMSGKFSTGRKT